MRVDRWLAGIDPGIVHTGVVAIGFTAGYQIHEAHKVFAACPGIDIAVYLSDLRQIFGVSPDSIVIEGYRPRSHFNTDKEMQSKIAELKQCLPHSLTLDNMGIKKIITSDLMKLFQVWDFPEKTHHQDLRSAARIALLQAFKDPSMNDEIHTLVKGHLEGIPIQVDHR